MRIHTAHILISHTCVNNCVFCAVADKRRKQKFPSKENVVRFIHDAAADGVRHLIFSGLGEPTLDPFFEEYLNVASKLMFEGICLFTNGHDLTSDKVTRWKNLGLSKVLLSIHGMEHGHDKNVQRRGAFYEAMSALDLYASADITITVNTCLTRLNLEEIPELRTSLSRYPISMHTLSFPEWSGNTEIYPEYLLDYEEVAAIAGRLIPEEDTITFFDNIPYCIVLRKTREMEGISTVLLLDGNEQKEFNPIKAKLFPESCLERRCLLLPRCSGFERKYIASRGWGDLKDRVTHFLDIPNNRIQDELPVKRRIRPPRQTRNQSEQVKSLPYHRDYLTIIVKPTFNCNAGCLYCASHRDSFTPSLTRDLLRRLYTELFSYAELAKIRDITFLWHGGEPLLMGKSFYADAWEEARTQKYVNIHHHIQTNLLLLDKEWVELFKRYGVRLSTSVDPLSQERVFKDGRLQYPVWLEKFILACRENLHIGIVFTITSAHRDRASDVFHFFKNLQYFSRIPLGIRLNPVYAAGKAITNIDPARNLTPAEFGNLLYEIWELWTRDGSRFPISPLQEWSGYGQLSCEFSGCCHEHFLSMTSTGDIYHCGRFADTGSPWGNIMTNKLTSILQHPQRLNLSRRAFTLREEQCNACILWEYCKGGCPYNAFIQFGDAVQKTPLCEAYQLFFKKSGLHMGTILEKRTTNA